MSKTIKKQICSPTKSLRSSYEPHEDIIIGKLLPSLEEGMSKGCQLPTKFQVFSHFLFLNDSHEMCYNSKHQVSKAVIEKVEVFWRQSGIPFSEYKTGRSKCYLQKLYHRYESIKKSVSRPSFEVLKNSFQN